MYDIEVCVPDRPSTVDLLSVKGGFKTHEAEIFYEERIIRLNVTWLWLDDYDTFVDELVGTIIHEYLHYFFHVNEMSQNEKIIEPLSYSLYLLSLGHLIGARGNRKEDIEQYEKCISIRFGKNFLS